MPEGHGVRSWGQAFLIVVIGKVKAERSKVKGEREGSSKVKGGR